MKSPFWNVFPPIVLKNESNLAGGSNSWCQPLKLPYNVIQSTFSLLSRWCHLPKKGITSSYGKKWYHERPYTPTQIPLYPDDVIFQNWEWCHSPRGLWCHERPSTPPTPLRMRPVIEPPFSYYYQSNSGVLSDNHTNDSDTNTDEKCTLGGELRHLLSACPTYQNGNSCRKCLRAYHMNIC